MRPANREAEEQGSTQVQDGQAWEAISSLAEVDGGFTPPIDGKTVEILEHRRQGSGMLRRGQLMRRMLLFGDALGLALAFLVAYIVLAAAGDTRIDAALPFVAFLATLPGWIVLAKIYGLYERDEERTDHSTADDLVGVFHLVTVGTWVFFVLSALTDFVHPSVEELVCFWALAVVFVALGRIAARSYGRRQLSYLQNTIIVGAGEVGQTVARKLLRRPEYGINLVGFVDGDPPEIAPDVAHVSMLGTPDQVSMLVRLFDVERVVIAFSNEAHSETLALVRALGECDVQVDIVPRLFEIVGPSVDLHTLEGMPLVGIPPLRLARSSLLLKRSIDIVGGIAGLIALAPLMAVIALRIKLDSPGPVFYRSERLGRNGEVFQLFKFRTMGIEHCRGDGYGGTSAEEEFERLMADSSFREEFERTHKLVDDPRVTKFGAFLRRTSLDELPQLLNVLTGDLSLVGPRPITMEEHGMYFERSSDPNVVQLDLGGSPNAPDAGERLAGYWEVEDLRPGVTGYWQIVGRSDIGYDERVRLDMAYVKAWSLQLDLMIMAKTARALTSSNGAY